MMREIASITSLIGAGMLVEAADVAHGDAEFVCWSSFGVGGGLTRPLPMRTGLLKLIEAAWVMLPSPGADHHAGVLGGL